MNSFANFPPLEISSSGLRAERVRMEVIANNIANANSTRSQDGGPYQRRQVVFETVINESMDGTESVDSGFGGVRVAGIRPDGSAPIMAYQPGHPDATPEGYVALPNVNLANEMVDLISANRGYEANLRVMRSFREMFQRTLTLLK
jgi:flagellar basal-body rod protein FlgC